MMRSLNVGFAVSFFVLLACAAEAQETITRPPEGRQVPGWAVESLPVSRRETRDRDGLNRLFGAVGLRRETVRSGPVLIDEEMAHNGRAFFRVQQPGRYTFMMNADGGGRHLITCSGALRIDDRPVLQFDAQMRYQRHLQRESTGIGSVDLTPGFYRLEYVFYCPRGARSVSYSVNIRDVNDASPRYFGPAELFHVQR